jgi:hypothetical protein
MVFTLMFILSIPAMQIYSSVQESPSKTINSEKTHSHFFNPGDLVHAKYTYGHLGEA